MELARFSLAKGSGPATRTQLFPHDKLLQLLIRHLRSQFSHGCASLEDAATTSSGLFLLCEATSASSCHVGGLGWPFGVRRLGMRGFFRGSELIRPGQSQGCFRGGRGQLLLFLAQLVSRIDWQAQKGHAEWLWRVQV